jgi:hypothetical protein
LQILRSEVRDKTSNEYQKSPPRVAAVSAISASVPSNSSFTDSKVLEKNLDEAKARIKDLELEISHLNEDLKMTVLRQKETGASANEALLQLESEIEKYVLSIDYFYISLIFW